MTDPGAPPLNPTLQQVEAVLRGIEERVSHDEQCIAVRRHSGLGFCYCQGRAARVRAEQARAVERIGMHLLNHVGEHITWKAHWAAALRAVAHT